MGNVRLVQKVFLTRPTVKHKNRSPANTDKYVRRVYVRDGPDRPIRSRIRGPISDIGPVGTKMFDFENAVTSAFRSLEIIENDSF